MIDWSTVLLNSGYKQGGGVLRGGGGGDSAQWGVCVFESLREILASKTRPEEQHLVKTRRSRIQTLVHTPLILFITERDIITKKVSYKVHVGSATVSENICNCIWKKSLSLLAP